MQQQLRGRLRERNGGEGEAPSLSKAVEEPNQEAINYEQRGSCKSIYWIRGSRVSFLSLPATARTITGEHSKQDPRYRQKPTFFPIFANPYGSYLLCSPVNTYRIVVYLYIPILYHTRVKKSHTPWDDFPQRFSPKQGRHTRPG